MLFQQPTYSNLIEDFSVTLKQDIATALRVAGLPAHTYSDNATQVLLRRYLKQHNGVSEPILDMYSRVATDLASVEATPEYHKNLFYNAMVERRFLPNSPTLMNAGSELQQLSACFVLPVVDSLKDIFETVTATAMIHKSGGGTGICVQQVTPFWR